ncbi:MULTISPECIES: hypothetical protein [Bacillus]|uniref:hypothetical protein n=1 Tax=Bacillus TaxID=1386 RepID=UPI00034BD36B|nr:MULTISPECIES: hypothetical protein [Bacillus cereus group]PEB07750.1 hypothetical protein COM56_06180 [Bacillus cereus]AWC31881.1 hypothetical protein CG482_005240 [Bacillus cytotoxicus]AWC35918.1 hypothetical protein CG481_005245 [Bacillus cytotoxicus]AWC60159.1 hypothetical protein CG474_005315 [Bacillus cytotoxicus]KMT50378.1 hypothetical protein TU51_05035 [Bacillus cytotoxicus]
MSYDTIASLQRIEQLKQSEAAAGDRLILKRADSKAELAITVAAFALALFTFGISLVIFAIWFLIKELTAKTYLVKNVATGEKFRVNRKDFKQYKKDFKAKEKEVKKISDL